MATTTQHQNQQSPNQPSQGHQAQGQRGNQNSGNQNFNSPSPGGQYQGSQNQNSQNHHGPNHHGPVESFRLSNVSISIFENESERDGQKSRYFRAKIDKRYRDQKSGEWKSTTSFSLDELLRLQHLINNAVDFMANKPDE